MVETPRKIIEHRPEYVDIVQEEIRQNSWSHLLGRDLEEFWESIYEEK